MVVSPPDPDPSLDLCAGSESATVEPTQVIAQLGISCSVTSSIFAVNYNFLNIKLAIIALCLATTRLRVVNWGWCCQNDRDG